VFDILMLVALALGFVGAAGYIRACVDLTRAPAGGNAP
jgi:hypothetical protein